MSQLQPLGNNSNITGTGMQNMGRETPETSSTLIFFVNGKGLQFVEPRRIPSYSITDVTLN